MEVELMGIDIPSTNSIYFSPCIVKQSLIKKLEKLTKINYRTINRIIGFLTYKSNQDLWAHPLIQIGNSLNFLLTPFIDAVYLRLVEIWSKELKHSEIGTDFEKNLKNIISEEIRISPFKNEIGIQGAKTYKGELKSKEEIDLLIKFGRNILVLEVSSRVTTDSPVSNWHAWNTIYEKMDQVKRKAKFVRNNLPKIFLGQNWRYSTKKKYKVIPLIATNNFACNGFCIGGIPIIDVDIFCQYFKKNYFTLFQEFPLGKKFILILYKSKYEAEINLMKYLKKPPQTDIPLLVSESQNIYPCLSDPKVKVLLTSILFQNLNDLDVLCKYRFSFPIEIIT